MPAEDFVSFSDRSLFVSIVCRVRVAIMWRNDFVCGLSSLRKRAPEISVRGNRDCCPIHTRTGMEQEFGLTMSFKIDEMTTRIEK